MGGSLRVCGGLGGATLVPVPRQGPDMAVRAVSQRGRPGGSHGDKYDNKSQGEDTNEKNGGSGMDSPIRKG
jgi:hypothetical protein